MDVEQLLHEKLDAARNAATVAQMRAARPFLRPSQRISTANIAYPAAHPTGPISVPRISNSRIPPMPIHTLPPPAPDEDDDATIVYDRASNPKVSLPRVSVPSVKAVAFPAPNFTAPRQPQPFSTVPAMPAAKKAAADASQGITPVQPVLPPTSRRELVMPKPNESVPPVSFPSPSQFPSYPPVMQAGARGSMLAVVMTMAFALASMAIIGVAVIKPALLERGKVAVASAMKPKAAKPALPPITAVQPPTTIAVPPILIDDEPDITIGDSQTYAIFPSSAKGHRVFIDGRPFDGDVPALLECGRHKVQIGSTGKERVVDLPCGGGLRLSE